MVRLTTFVPLREFGVSLGFKDLWLASEAFQLTGSFKFRAAWELVNSVDESDRIIGASSGNFGQALAYACALVKKKALIVMPTTSAAVKVAAVKNYGAEVDFIDTNLTTRADRLEFWKTKYPKAYIASPYDDEHVIRGNSGLGYEIFQFSRRNPINVVIVPVGGGGLISGVVKGINVQSNKTTVIGAEPLLANDAARSLRAGVLLANDVEPQTIADGARTLKLGLRNWEIIKTHVPHIVEVEEDAIRRGVRTLFDCNMLVEPTAALALAAAISDRKRFEGQSVCCVVSGGNVDPEVYARLITE